MQFIKTIDGTLVNVGKIGSICRYGNSIRFYQNAITTTSVEPSGYLYKGEVSDGALVENIYNQLCNKIAGGTRFIEMAALVLVAKGAVR
jgi:hypothetical protein